MTQASSSNSQIRSTKDFPLRLDGIPPEQVASLYMEMRRSHKALAISRGAYAGIARRKDEELRGLQQQLLNLQNELMKTGQDRARAYEGLQYAVAQISRMNEELAEQELRDSELFDAFQSAVGTDGSLSLWDRLRLLLSAVRRYFDRRPVELAALPALPSVEPEGDDIEDRQS